MAGFFEGLAAGFVPSFAQAREASRRDRQAALDRAMSEKRFDFARRQAEREFGFRTQREKARQSERKADLATENERFLDALKRKQNAELQAGFERGQDRITKAKNLEVANRESARRFDATQGIREGSLGISRDRLALDQARFQQEQAEQQLSPQDTIQALDDAIQKEALDLANSKKDAVVRELDPATFPTVVLHQQRLAELQAQRDALHRALLSPEDRQNLQQVEAQALDAAIQQEALDTASEAVQQFGPINRFVSGVTPGDVVEVIQNRVFDPANVQGLMQEGILDPNDPQGNQDVLQQIQAEAVRKALAPDSGLHVVPPEQQLRTDPAVSILLQRALPSFLAPNIQPPRDLAPGLDIRFPHQPPAALSSGQPFPQDAAGRQALAEQIKTILQAQALGQ